MPWTRLVLILTDKQMAALQQAAELTNQTVTEFATRIVADVAQNVAKDLD